MENKVIGIIDTESIAPAYSITDAEIEEMKKEIKESNVPRFDKWPEFELIANQGKKSAYESKDGLKMLLTFLEVCPANPTGYDRITKENIEVIIDELLQKRCS